jgi:serine protease AprX
MFRHASFSIRIIVCWLFMLAPVPLPGVAPADVFAQFLPPLPTLPPPLPQPLLPPPPPAPNPLDKLDPVLRTEISNLFAESRVIVRVANGGVIGSVAAVIQQLGGVPGRELPIVNALAARMPNAAIPVLAASSSVQRIALDRLVLGSLERTGRTVGATAARAAFGYDGLGVGVAVVDSGISGAHHDLSESAPAGTQRVRQFVDFVSSASQPYDDYGHGTHVSGIIAGNGFDSGGARSGIAPAAHLVVLKVLDQQGRGNISNVIAALDYVATNKDAFAIRIVNLSIGAPVHESFETDLLTLAAKRLVDLGIVVVAAAGNAGKAADGRLVYGSVGAPGNAPWVLTVGASSHMGTDDRTDDIVAQFSSRGPTVVDRLAKPDIVAPGVGIVSLSDAQSLLYQLRPANRFPGTAQTPEFPYFSLSGTSQATPVVTGTVALMLQANPSLTPNAVKAILEYTARVGATEDWVTQGAGFLNTPGALELARFFAQPSSAFPDTPEWARHIIWGNRRVHGGRLTPGSDAWSTSVVWGGYANSAGQPVTWGLICAEGTNCDVAGWSTWGTGASSTGISQNVVWGTECGGDNCSSATWSTNYDDDTVVWGNSGEDDDTVVWGNNADDDDTVVWGNSDDDTVVWGNNCSTTACEQ